MSMSNKTYDALKWIAQILLPALGTLYFALAAIWGLPAAEQVVGTITAVDTFLGVLLGLSSKTYTPPVDGILHVDHDKKEVYAALETPTRELDKAGTATLTVKAL